MGGDVASIPEEGGQKPEVTKRNLGLIINPVAGIGGRVGLKGSDGAEVQRKARALGAVPHSMDRAIQALERIKRSEELMLVTCPGEMGGGAAEACGLEHTLVCAGSIGPPGTTAADTKRAAREMLGLKIDLLLFAGGDGTARDIYDAIGDSLPVLGIPAGVKIQSAAYSTNPVYAGDLALSFLEGRTTGLREAEVVDIDEEALRQGSLSARLYGYLRIPSARRLTQGMKTPTSLGEQSAIASISEEVVSGMREGCLYVIGPGTTTRAINSKLGLDKTLTGVDIVADGRLVAADVNESQLLEHLRGNRAKIVVTPIGGQGCILGRGNQQISPKVIKAVGASGRNPGENIIVVSTTEKIHSLGGRPLWVDTGDRALDRLLCGYIRVVTGFNEQIVYRVSC